jgi:SAM-dependent methyltransferase
MGRHSTRADSPMSATSAATMMGPDAYTAWRATSLGRITGGLGQRLIVGLMGESFDVVVSVTVLCFVPDAAEAVGEMAHALAGLNPRLGNRTTVGAAFVALTETSAEEQSPQ